MAKHGAWWVILLGVLVSGAGCATVVRGDKQKIRFETEPAGATVQVAGETHTTPATVKLKRKEAHTVLITKEGYQPVTFTMKAKWDGAALPNVAMPGGSIGMATDRAKGSDLAFYPLPKIKLTPATQPTTQPIQMYQWRKALLTEEEYKAAIDEEIREWRSRNVDF